MQNVNIDMAVGIAPMMGTLYRNGVIAIHGNSCGSGEPEVQLKENVFRKSFPFENGLHPRSSKEYPYELRTRYRNVNFIALVQRKKKNDEVLAS